jgi:hypothetical protein
MWEVGADVPALHRNNSVVTCFQVQTSPLLKGGRGVREQQKICHLLTYFHETDRKIQEDQMIHNQSLLPLSTKEDHLSKFSL